MRKFTIFRVVLGPFYSEKNAVCSHRVCLRAYSYRLSGTSSPPESTGGYINYITPQPQLQLHYTNYITLQLQLHYATLHPAVLVRWPLQPLQPLQKTQLQPPFGPSADSLCHLWFTATNLSYRFPILETSATALRGTTGIVHIFLELVKGNHPRPRSSGKRRLPENFFWFLFTSLCCAVLRTCTFPLIGSDRASKGEASSQPEAHPCWHSLICFLKSQETNSTCIQQASFQKWGFARAKHQGPWRLLFLWCASCWWLGSADIGVFSRKFRENSANERAKVKVQSAEEVGPVSLAKKCLISNHLPLKGDSVMLAACLQGYKWSVIIRRNFAGGERIFIRALLPNMGPPTDKHGVRKSFTKVTCWVAKTGHTRIKEFWSPTTIFLLVMMSPFLSMLQSWGAFVAVCICVLHYRVSLSSMPPCFKNLRCSQPAEIPGLEPTVSSQLTI